MTKYKFLLLTILYAGGILWFSLQPDYPTDAPANTWMMMFRDFLHIPAYAGLAALLKKVTDTFFVVDVGRGLRAHRISEIKKVSVTFFVATLFGILNEFVQACVPGRFYSIGDMIRNAIGAAIGLWIVYLIRMKDL